MKNVEICTFSGGTEYFSCTYDSHSVSAVQILKVGRWLFSGHSSVLEHSQLTLEDLS